MEVWEDHFLPTIHTGSLFSTPSPEPIFCLWEHTFWQGWDDRTLWFWFSFPWWLVMLTILLYTCWPFVYLLLRHDYPGPLPIFNLGYFFLPLGYGSFLYIVDIISLSDVFSHSEGCLFILLVISFAVQKLFSLMQSHLFIFVFVACAFGILLKKSLSRPMSRSFFLMFSPIDFRPYI